MAWDAGSISSRLEVDTQPFHAELERAKAEAREFADKRYTTTVDINTRRSQDDLAAVEQRLHSIESTVDRINTKGGGGRGGGGLLSGFAGASIPNPSFRALGIGAALPLAGPLGGVALGAGASLLTPALAGGLGLGAFGAGAKSSFTTIDKDVATLTKLTQQYDAATTNKQRAAVLTKEKTLWDNLDPAQRKAVKNVQGLDAAWASYKKKLEPQSFKVIADGAKIAATGLGLLLPVAQAVGDEVDSLEKRAEKALTQPFWHQFFGRFLPGEAKLAVDSLGVSLGNGATGIAHLMEAFAPLGHDLERDMVNLSARFEKWTEGTGPAKFVTWVEKEGPVAGRTLLGIVKTVEGIASGLLPIGQDILAIAGPVLNFVGGLAKSNPDKVKDLGLALLIVGAGLKAINLAQGAAGVLSKIPGLGGKGFGGGSGGGVVGRLGAQGSSPANPLYVAVVDKVPGGGSPVPGGGGKGPLGTIGTIAAGIALTGATVTDKLGPPTQKLSGGGLVRGDLAGYLKALLPLEFQVAKTSGQKLPSDVGKNGSNAIDFIHANANPAQMQQLQALATTYPQIAAAVKDISKQESVLNQYLVVNTGLAGANARAVDAQNVALRRELSTLAGLPGYLKAAENAAESGGFVIGKNLTAGIIIGIRQGADKVALESVKVVQGALRASRTTAALGSPSKITTQYGRWIAEGLSVGFLQQNPQVIAAFKQGTAAGMSAIGQAVTSAQNQLTSDLQARSQAVSGVAGGLSGAYGLGNAFGPYGNALPLNAFLGGGAKTLARENTLLKRLGSKHLSASLLAQIAGLSPQQGVAMATNILSGASGSIATLNKDQAAIERYANAIGTTTVAGQYAQTIAHDRAMLAEAKQTNSLLAALIKDNPHLIGKAVAAALDAAIRGAEVHRRG